VFLCLAGGCQGRAWNAEPDQPKPGFGKIQTDFETARQVSYGHGRIEDGHLATAFAILISVNSFA